MSFLKKLAERSIQRLKSNARDRMLTCLTAVIAGGTFTGCTSLTTPISGIPASRVPPQFLAEPKNNYVPIDVGRLSQRPPRQYLLDGGDILGVYVEGVLPFTPPDEPPEPPPVNFPERESTLPPSLGFPIAVQDDGTIALPSIRPLNVRGMTVEQVREAVRNEYLRAEVLQEDGGQVLTPIVTLIRERTYNVVVVRQDISMFGGMNQMAQFQRGGYLRGGDQSASGDVIQLPAYQNDVLHALMQTGGLPGLNAKNEVKILKASRYRPEERDRFVQEFYHHYFSNPDPCGCPPPLPDDPNITRIPLRLPPGVTPNFRPEDVILEDGDVVLIDSRDAEVFYTGGLLQGGEWPIPRDYDLDVLGAMAIAGGGIASRGSVGGGVGGAFGGLQNSIGGVPPGRVYILRRTPCNGQVNIEVDLARAINNPRERILIQPGDTLVLQFKPEEELLNFGLGTFFTYGIQELLRGN
jgi:hypothetical protein